MTTRTPGTEPEVRLLSLSEVSTLLRMKRPNVAKFLARRGVPIYAKKAQGYLWLEDDILRVKAEREADRERMEADERRRASALGGRRAAGAQSPELARMGASQRRLLPIMLRRPFKPESEADRHALRRLKLRGLAVPLDDASGKWTLTDDGRRLAAEL